MTISKHTADIESNEVRNECTPLLRDTGKSTDDDLAVKYCSFPSEEELYSSVNEDESEADKSEGVVKVIFCILLLGLYT